MFIDPYGIEIEWETFKAVAATKAIDVWYLFSLSGFSAGNTPHERHRRPASGRRSPANSAPMHGSVSYTRIWVRQISSAEQDKRRTADVKGLERYAKTRLETIFPKVLNPLALPLRRSLSATRCSSACLIPTRRLLGLATRIAGHILKVGNSS